LFFASIIGGKLYLGSYAHRLGATGLTFYDDQVTDFFSPHAIGKSVMFKNDKKSINDEILLNF